MHRSKFQSVALIILFGLGVGASLTANAGYFDDLIGEASNSVKGGATNVVKDVAKDTVQDNLKKTEDDTPGNEPADNNSQPSAARKSSTNSLPQTRLSIQGITTGMADTEIRDHLLVNGWTDQGVRARPNALSFKKEDGSKDKQIKIAFVEQGGIKKANNVAYTLVFQTPNFDAAAVLGQIKEKFGAPVHENSANLVYREFPNAPMANKVSPSCQNEMLARNKDMIASQAAGKVQQVTNLNWWVSQGDSLVKEYCPNTVPLFHEYLKGAFGKKLNVNVPPGGRTITMVLEEPGVLYKAQRLAHLEKERKTNAAPKAEMEASDF